MRKLAFILIFTTSLDVGALQVKLGVDATSGATGFQSGNAGEILFQFSRKHFSGFWGFSGASSVSQSYQSQKFIQELANSSIPGLSIASAKSIWSRFFLVSGIYLYRNQHSNLYGKFELGQETVKQSYAVLGNLSEQQFDRNDSQLTPGFGLGWSYHWKSHPRNKFLSPTLYGDFSVRYSSLFKRAIVSLQLGIGFHWGDWL